MKQRVFVLVHPAWHGAWCWKKVVPLLREGGHRVFTPTLTGLGERSHLARPEIGLGVHVSDIVNVLEYEDLREVVLVGHSSSGVVITGVADRAPAQLAQVVYLDAFVPEDGQAVLDLIAPDRRQIMETLVKTEGKGWLLSRFAPPPWETIVRDMWGVTDDDDVRWMLPRLGPTPFGHFQDPVRRTNPAAEKLPRAYIRCRQFQTPVSTSMPAWHGDPRTGGIENWRCRTTRQSPHRTNWRICCWNSRPDHSFSTPRSSATLERVDLEDVGSLVSCRPTMHVQEQDPNFPRKFLLVAVEEGIPVQVALGKVIRVRGEGICREGAEGQSERAARDQPERHSPTQDRFNRLPRPFKLRVVLTPIEPSKRWRTA